MIFCYLFSFAYPDSVPFIELFTSLNYFSFYSIFLSLNSLHEIFDVRDVIDEADEVEFGYD